MRAIGIAVTASAMAAASGATACSLNNWNAYIPDGTPLSKAISDAATIDLIRVRSGPPYCTTTEDEYYNAPAGPPTAGGCAEGSPRQFKARVLERFKGRSPRTYTMTWKGDWEGSWRGGYNPLGSYRGFSDPRELPSNIQNLVQDQYAASVSTPLGVDFWDAPHVGFTTDMSSSCGGFPTALVGKTYLAFRRSNSSFISLIPASSDGDGLTERLREFTQKPNIQLGPSLGLIEYFKAQKHVALVQILACKSADNYEDEVGKLKLIQGRAEIFTSLPPSRATPSENIGEYNYRELPDFFNAIGQACPPEGSTYLMISRFKESDWSNNPRFIPVDADSLVQKRDIPTEIKLIGPDSFTVDEALQWVGNGEGANAPPPFIFQKHKSLPASEPKGIWQRIIDFFKNLFG